MTSGRPTSTEHWKPVMPKTTPKMMEQCAQMCHECQDMCLRCIVHCLDMGGEHASRKHQTMLTDCAAICGLSHGFLHRQSPHHSATCGVCAEICHACADDCESMANGDKMMKECAQMCKRCAESCEQMAEEDE